LQWPVRNLSCLTTFLAEAIRLALPDRYLAHRLRIAAVFAEFLQQLQSFCAGFDERDLAFTET
jgi:hypothetical protein